MRMVQRGDGSGLLLESRREIFVRDLDGNVTAKARIAGAIDLTHAARADAREDLVGSQSSPRRERHRNDSAKFTRLRSGLCPYYRVSVSYLGITRSSTTPT